MLQQELLRRKSLGKPIRVGSSGAGWMGSGFVAQVSHVPGMTVNVLADHDISLARKAFIDVGVSPDDIIEADAVGPAEDALNSGKHVEVDRHHRRQIRFCSR